jgi:hypothetical protein
MRKVYINRKPLDFNSAWKQHKVVPGCGEDRPEEEDPRWTGGSVLSRLSSSASSTDLQHRSSIGSDLLDLASGRPNAKEITTKPDAGGKFNNNKNNNNPWLTDGQTEDEDLFDDEYEDESYDDGGSNSYKWPNNRKTTSTFSWPSKSEKSQQNQETLLATQEKVVSSDPCFNNKCVKGKCVPEPSPMLGDILFNLANPDIEYSCKCRRGWSGRLCDQSKSFQEIF